MGAEHVPARGPLGRKYTLAILDALADEEALRYGRLRETTGVRSDGTLSDRLRQLERCGLIERHAYDECPPRVEYAITEDGEAAVDHLAALYDLVA